MISGKLFRDAVINAAICLESKKKQVDELNVYPVPDGDTGTNMSMTINAAKKELLLLGDEVTVSKVADTAASAMLFISAFALLLDVFKMLLAAESIAERGLSHPSDMCSRFSNIFSARAEHSTVSLVKPRQ